MLGIGEIIRVNRNEFGYSQEELCFGICTPSNLSKIENGEQVPSRATFNALMERMGLSAGVYPSFLSDRDKEAFEMKYDFNELYAKGKFDDAEKVLDKIETIPKLRKDYTRFLSVARTLLKQQKETVSNEEAAEAFEEHIKTFIKGFAGKKLERIRRSLLTKTEISVLNAYAIAKHLAGDVETAKKVLYECITYIESKVYDKEGIAVIYTKLLYNLSKFVGMDGDDEEAIRLCDLGIKACIRYNRFTFLSVLLFNKGYGLMNMNRVAESHDCIRESYYIQRAMGEIDKVNLSFIVSFAKKHEITLL